MPTCRSIVPQIYHMQTALKHAVKSDCLHTQRTVLHRSKIQATLLLDTHITQNWSCTYCSLLRIENVKFIPFSCWVCSIAKYIRNALNVRFKITALRPLVHMLPNDPSNIYNKINNITILNGGTGLSRWYKVNICLKTAVYGSSSCQSVENHKPKYVWLEKNTTRLFGYSWERNAFYSG